MRCIVTYYWLEELPLEGMFCISGAAPPSSRKFIDTPNELPLLLDASMPLKYLARLTAVPLYVPLARMPGTAMPTLGLV